MLPSSCSVFKSLSDSEKSGGGAGASFLLHFSFIFSTTLFFRYVTVGMMQNKAQQNKTKQHDCCHCMNL